MSENDDFQFSALAVKEMEKDSLVLKPNQTIKPPITKAHVPSLVERIYGLRIIDFRQLISYDDRNFHIRVEENHNNPHLATVNPDGYTLKITNWLDSSIPGFLESIHEVQFHLSSNGIFVPLPVLNLQGIHCLRMSESELENVESKEANPDEKQYAVQLLTYIPGVTFFSIPYTENVLFQFGHLLAKLTKAYEGFHNPVLAKRESLWSLFGVPKIMDFLFAVKDEQRRILAEETIKDFTLNVLPIANKMPKFIIHGDFNEHNVLVRKLKTQEKIENESVEVYGVLDFTDNHLAPIIFEVAIALMYSMLECNTMDPLLATAHALAGYLSIKSLDEIELGILKKCIEARLSQSLVMGAYTFNNDPSNEYALSSSRQGWTLLKRMRETPDGQLEQKWREVLQKYHRKEKSRQ